MCGPYSPALAATSSRRPCSIAVRSPSREVETTPHLQPPLLFSNLVILICRLWHTFCRAPKEPGGCRRAAYLRGTAYRFRLPPKGPLGKYLQRQIARTAYCDDGDRSLRIGAALSHDMHHLPLPLLSRDHVPFFEGFGISPIRSSRNSESTVLPSNR